MSGQNTTFLEYVSNRGVLEEVVELHDDLLYAKNQCQQIRAELEQGFMVDRDGTQYTWKDLCHGDGSKAYNSREEWEKEQLDYIAQCTEEAEDCIDYIEEYFQDFLHETHQNNLVLEEELQKVAEFSKMVNDNHKEITLLNFLMLQKGGEACVSIHQEPYDYSNHRYTKTYFEEEKPEDVLVSETFKDIANAEVDHFHVIGGGMYKVELCIYLKEN